MRRLIIPAVFVLVAVMSSGCAITRSYGPYMGRVVDLETQEPLPGTVVFVRFYTVGIELMHHYVDAVETVSDGNGEFHIPRQRLFTTPFPFEHWQEEGDFIIFKPGYGVQFYVPENKYTVIRLRKLKTRKEREKAAIDDLWLGSGVPKGKFKLIENAIRQELNFLDNGE
jgi:hypothetical protein